MSNSQANSSRKYGKIKWHSEDYAAQSRYMKSLSSISFDPSEDDMDDDFENFLEMFKPSQISSSDGFGEIYVLGPKHRRKTEEKTDFVGLVDAWKAAQESKKAVTAHTVFELAESYNHKGGQWLFYKEPGIKTDLAWASVARACVLGQCGREAKVSTIYKDMDDEMHLFVVHTNDFTDKKDVFHVLDEVRRAGIKCDMKYKLNTFTLLKIYRNNEWDIIPTTHFSQYDLMAGKSKIINTYHY